MLPAKLVAELHDSIPPDRFYTDPVDCYAYSYDNSRKIFPPDGVLFPLTSDEIQHIVKLCNQYQTPLIPRGRGTGTAGGSLPEKGGIALSMERMLNIVSVDPANRVIVTEPGVLNQSIQDTAKPHGFFGPPIRLVLHFQRLVEILLLAREDRTQSNMEPLGNTF